MAAEQRKRPPDRVALERELSYWRGELRLHEQGAEDCQRKVAEAQARLREREGNHASQ